MNELQVLESLIGKNVNFTITDIINLLSGQPVSIQVDPLNQPIAGKTLTVALTTNAITIQLH